MIFIQYRYHYYLRDIFTPQQLNNIVVCWFFSIQEYSNQIKKNSMWSNMPLYAFFWQSFENLSQFSGWETESMTSLASSELKTLPEQQRGLIIRNYSDIFVKNNLICKWPSCYECWNILFTSSFPGVPNRFLICFPILLCK